MKLTTTTHDYLGVDGAEQKERSIEVIVSK